MKKASSLHRILAALFDTIIVGVMCFLCMIPAIACFINININSSFPNAIALFVSSLLSGGLVIIAIVSYSVILPVLWRGQTLGKRFFMIKTKKMNGENVDYKTMFIRVISRLAITFISFGLSIIVDFITVCASKNHNTFYDVIASTSVNDILD